MPPACAGAEGKANFGFVANPGKGNKPPTGNAQFNFHAGEFAFNSETIVSLSIIQDGKSAQFSGLGNVNGANAPDGGLYNFTIWVTDGAPDTFRIRIWWEENGTEHVVYDTGTGLALGGGSITIHKQSV